MKGFSATIFVEDGLEGWKAEYKAVAADSVAGMREQLAFVTACLVRQITRLGGPGGKDIGVYLEVYDVPPPLEVYYDFHANMGNGKSPEMTWEKHKTRSAWVKENGGQNNGKK